MNPTENQFWRKCSSCKNPIGLGASYFACSVSTCSGPRTGYVFCSVPCFERHLPMARHREAGAVEMKAPTTPNSVKLQTTGKSSAPSAAIAPREVLIIASRLKEYVQSQADMNTSASVMDYLSDYLRVICDRGIDNARAEGRKTLMDRDFHFLKNQK